MSHHMDSYAGPRGDGALVQLLYPAPAERRTGAIIRWWEKRRLPYNLIVGAGGLMTLGLHTLVHSIPGETVEAIVAVGVMANVAYTLGSIVEVTVNHVWGRKVLPLGPMLFREGLLFSVGLTLILPTIILTAGAIARIMGWVFAA